MKDIFQAAQFLFVDIADAQQFKNQLTSVEYSIEDLERHIIRTLNAQQTGKLATYKSLIREFPNLSAIIKSRIFTIEKMGQALLTFHLHNIEYQCFVVEWTHLWIRLSLHKENHEQERLSESIKQLFEQIYAELHTFDEFSGKLVAQYIQNLTKTVAQAVRLKQAPSIEQIQHQFAKSQALFEQLKAENLKSTLIRVSQLSKEREARDKTSMAISQAIGDGHYPVVFLKFIENYVAPELENCFIKQGAKSSKWKLILKAIRIIIWAFRANCSDTFKDEFQRKVMPALRDLCDNCLDGYVEQTRFINDFILIEELLKRKSLGYFDKLNTVFNAPHVNSSSLFKRSVEINCTLDSKEHHPVRGVLYYQNRLIQGFLLTLKDENGYLVFLNSSFELAIAIDRNRKNMFQTEAHLFAPTMKVDWRYIRVFADSELAQLRCKFEMTFESTLEVMRTNNELDKRERYEQERFELQQRLNGLQQEFAQREHQLKEIKQEQAAKQKNVSEYTNIIDKIKDGALGQLIEGDVKIPVTLITITQSTGRYIFNKSNGQGQLSLKRSELAAMLLSDQLIITEFESPDHFKNSLESIIRMRRSNLSPTAAMAV